MITKIITIDEYRKNLTAVWKESQEKNIRFIVTRYSKPILVVKGFEGNQV